MSLLEGHADVVMDSVGPEVIPSVELIRSKFTVRRQGQGFDRIVRKLLGLDAKMRQYRDGAAFCRAVIERSAWTASTGSGPRRRRCRPARRSPIRSCGWPGCTPRPPRAAEKPRFPVARRALGPARLQLVNAIQAALHTSDGALLVACSGGADSLALAAAATVVARRRSLPLAAVVVDHGLQAESGRRCDRRRCAAFGVRHRRRTRAAGFRRRRRRTGSGSPRGPLRGAPGRSRPHRLDRAARPHPRRPGRDGPARSGPGLGDPLTRRHGIADRSVSAPVARCAAVRHRGSLRRAGGDAMARSAQRRPDVRPRAGAASSPAGAGGRARAGHRGGAGPDRGTGSRRRRPARSAGRRSQADVMVAGELDCAGLANLPPALRSRVLRTWLDARGARDLGQVHVAAVEALVVDWHGQGAIDVPGLAVRRGGRSAHRSGRRASVRTSSHPIAQLSRCGRAHPYVFAPHRAQLTRCGRPHPCVFAPHRPDLGTIRPSGPIWAMGCTDVRSGRWNVGAERGQEEPGRPRARWRPTGRTRARVRPQGAHTTDVED